MEHSYPSKTTMNLAMREKRKFPIGRFLVLLPLVLLLAGAFGKYAVADRLKERDQAEAALANTRQQINALERATADYDAVSQQYRLYTTDWMTDEEKATVDCITALDIVERELMSVGSVQQFSVQGALIALELTGVTLEGTAQTVEKLYRLPEVRTVSVYQATNQPESEPVVSMVITLTAEGSDVK